MSQSFIRRFWCWLRYSLLKHTDFTVRMPRSLDLRCHRPPSSKQDCLDLGPCLPILRAASRCISGMRRSSSVVCTSAPGTRTKTGPSSSCQTSSRNTLGTTVIRGRRLSRERLCTLTTGSGRQFTSQNVRLCCTGKNKITFREKVGQDAWICVIGGRGLLLSSACFQVVKCVLRLVNYMAGAVSRVHPCLGTRISP